MCVHRAALTFRTTGRLDILIEFQGANNPRILIFVLKILVKPKQLGNLVKFTQFNGLRIKFESRSRKRKLRNGALKLWIRCLFLFGPVLMMIAQQGLGNIDFLLCTGLLLIFCSKPPPPARSTQSSDNESEQSVTSRLPPLA